MFEVTSFKFNAVVVCDSSFKTHVLPRLFECFQEEDHIRQYFFKNLFI